MKKLANKIRIVACLLILAIIAVGSSVIYVINETTVDAVEKIEMTDCTDTTISVKWKKADGAEGYRIFIQNSESGEYEKYKDIENGNTCKLDITDMNNGSVYSIKITAFTVFRNKEYVSEESEPLTVYTLPSRLEVAAVSDDEGVLGASWTAIEKAAGYELEYSKDSDFKDAQQQTLEGAQTNTFSVNGLTPKDVYYVHGRAYILFNDEKIYGEWSEPSSAEIKDRVKMPEDIDLTKPIVALSFDDGPSYAGDANATERILATLEKYGARATFFMVGSRVNDANAYLLKKEIELGCEIGNHTYSHKNYGKKVTASDISSSSSRIEQYCGQAPTMFRCPGGMMSSVIQKECQEEGMPIAYWSVDTQDWKSKNADTIFKKTMNDVYDGSIILMHDIYPSTADAVEKIVPALIENGYQIVTVSELVQAKTGSPAKAGQQYVTGEKINNNT